MTLHRTAAKRDEAEGPIVEYLRAAGWSVEYLSIKDGPDLIAGHGSTQLIEVKSGNEPLRSGQVKWHARWRGSPVVILRSVADAEQLVRYGPAGLT